MPSSTSHAFVTPVAHPSHRRTTNASASATRRPPTKKKHSSAGMQTLIRASPQGFGAAEELEVFLHLSRHPTPKPTAPKRGGAGTPKQRHGAHNVPRVAECYVMPSCCDVVTLHPGF